MTTFPEEVKEILINARYWRNTNILNEIYVEMIIQKVEKIINNKIKFFDELEGDEQEKLLFAPVTMALNDLKKEFRGEKNEEE